MQRSSLARLLVASGANRFNIRALPRWSAAVRAMLAGTANVDVLCIGDSTTVGYGAVTILSYDSARPVSYPMVLVGLLNNAGYRTKDWAISSTNGCSSATEYATYDPRVTFATPADWTMNGETLGGRLWQVSANTSRMVLSLPDPIDRIRFYGANAASASGNLYIDGSGSALGGLTQTTGNTAYATDFTPTRGVHTVELARASGVFYSSGIVCADSTQKNIRVWNAGYAGKSAVQIGTTQTGAWATATRITTIAPALTIINLGINDYAGSTQAAYKAAMQTLIDAAKLSGDVLLMIPNPTAGGGATQVAFAGYIRDLGLLNSCPIVDLQARWGSYAAAVSSGFMRPATDQVHPVTLGYADMAAAVKSAITP